MASQKNGPQGQVRKEIEETFGFVPGFYEALPEHAMEHAWGLHRSMELSDETALDNKTKELIGLAVASHIKCRYCIYFHDKAARMFGASDEEIREANMMGGVTVLFSNAISGAQTDYETFKKDVDRAIAYVSSQAPAKSTKPSNRPRA